MAHHGIPGGTGSVPARARFASLAAVAALASLPAVVAVAACGGGEPAPATAANPPVSASAAGASASASSSAAPAASTAEALPPASAAPVAPVPAPTSTVATTKTDAAWASCHQNYKAKGKADAAKDVEAMARGCAGATKMKPIGKPWTGKQADQDKPQSFPFEAKAHHCYRAYAQASDGIKDLDLVIKDSADVIVGQDSTDDPSPVVLEDGAVCFSKDDKASVVVSVGMGSGTFAAQVWGD